MFTITFPPRHSDFSKCNLNANQALSPTIWLTIFSSFLSWADVDQVCVWRIVKNRNCIMENCQRSLIPSLFSSQGSRDKPQSQYEALVRAERQSEGNISSGVRSILEKVRDKRRESGNGPQSLSLPPTRQNMSKARGMPHIYFPSFPFLITTHA